MEDFNEEKFVFENTDTDIIAEGENIENNENDIKEKTPIDLDNLSSSLDEVQIDINKAEQTPKPRNDIRKPLNIHNPKVPNVVRLGQLYEARKKYRMEKIEKEEREKRKFHAKPAPNFSSIHAAQSQKRNFEEHKITVPVTPRVVHTHRENMKKIKAKVCILLKKIASFFYFLCNFINQFVIIC